VAAREQHEHLRMLRPESRRGAVGGGIGALGAVETAQGLQGVGRE
jgi:hypothetical protein